MSAHVLFISHIEQENMKAKVSKTRQRTHRFFLWTIVKKGIIMTVTQNLYCRRNSLESIAKAWQIFLKSNNYRLENII